ncbi:MAG: peptidyl-prolyl cis-trans isomerase [Candidatus Eisenbacteria bacterium]|nr:peptidyl-prolyl cis-trans isomerase [Candidatus Eisenbacteria bacterium]
MNRGLSAGLLLTLLVTLAAGCSRKANDPTLATVGEKTIRLSHYVSAWQGLPDQSKPDVATPEARLAFLNDLINKDVMEMEARRRQPELEETQRRRLHRFAETQLMNQLTEVEINRKIKVDDAEIRPIWNRMDREFHARHILVPTQEQALDIRKQLDAGATFEDMAREHSKDPDNATRGGDLGWVTAGVMVQPFEEALFELEPGEISPPVMTRFGWHLIKVDEKRTAERPEFDAVREKVYMLLLQQRSLARQEAFQKELNEKGKPQNQIEAIQLIDKKYYFEVPAAQANDPYAMLNANRTTPAFTKEELALPVIKFADRPDFTMQAFNEQLSWMPPGLWPSGKGLDEIETLLRQMTRTKLYRDHALALGLEKTPEYFRLIQKKESEMRVNGLYYNQVLGAIQLTDTDRRNFFDQHPENYRVAERYRLSRIETPDSSVAVLAYRAWKTGKDFADIESLVKGLDPTAGAVAASFEIPRGQSAPVDTVVFQSRIGDIIGPIFLESTQLESGQTLPPRWLVGKVLDIKPERLMTYEEAESFVAEHAKTARAEEDLKKILEDARVTFKVKVDDAAMAKLTAATIQEAPKKSVPTPS